MHGFIVSRWKWLVGQLNGTEGVHFPKSPYFVPNRRLPLGPRRDWYASWEGNTMCGLRSLGLIVLSVYGSQLFGADDPFVGTWTLNSEKSVFEGSSSLPMKVALEIKRGDSGTLVINMTGFGNAQPLQLEVVAGYEHCDGEEHIVNSSRPSTSWPETSTTPASVRAISCIRIDDHNRGLSTTVRQGGKLLGPTQKQLHV